MNPLTFDLEKCTRCGACVAECPLRLVTLREEGPGVVAGDEELCIACGHCVAVCPEAAASHVEVPVGDCPPLDASVAPKAETVEAFLRARRSIRQYQGTPVSPELLERLIRLACFAPSGHNSQPWEWLVISGRAELDALAGHVLAWMRERETDQPELFQRLRWDRILDAAAAGQDRILRGAPHLVIVHAAKDNRLAPAASITALAYLELAAPSLGLGTCWAGYLTTAAGVFAPLQGALGLPEGHVTYGAAMVGHPAVHYARFPVRREPRIRWR
jgi:nitroreductase/NAD-dependent dihydropyrimidine dehydrogenase PreA subunit